MPLQPKSKTPEAVSKLYKTADAISLPPPEKLAAFRDLVVGAQQGKVHVSVATSEVSFWAVGFASCDANYDPVYPTGVRA